jgi:hypothetical protein
VAFHVEIRRGMQRARVFNLAEAELRARVLGPWSAGAPVALGDQEWEPRESVLTVLESDALPAADLAHGQGWNRAERIGRDVTADVLGTAATIAVLARSAEAGRIAATVVDALGVHAVDWAAVRAALLAGDRAAAGIPAALLIADNDPAWLLDAGLARGALGRRAVIARLDGGAATEPPELGAIALDAGDEAAAQALAERLRDALLEAMPPSGSGRAR